MGNIDKICHYITNENNEPKKLKSTYISKNADPSIWIVANSVFKKSENKNKDCKNRWYLCDFDEIAR